MNSGVARRAGLLLLVSSMAMSQKPKIKFTTCVEPIKAFGEHVRFSAEDHVKILLAQKRSEDEYREWERASRALDWFSGKARVSLATIKGHMPRAMLLELRFPVDRNPPVDPKGYAALVEAERKYEEATRGHGSEFYQDLMKKYGIGPTVMLDQDMGGATPVDGCGRFEERSQ